MTVAILEPHASGHRPYYVRWIAEGLLAAGRRVVIGGGPELLAHPEVAGMLAGSDVDAECLPLAVASGRTSTPWSMARRQLAYRAYFGCLHDRIAGNRSVGNVVIPYVDYCLYALAMKGAPFRSSAWCGITMRTRPPGSGVRAALRWRLVERLCNDRSLTRLFTIDPAFTAAGASSLRHLPPKLAYLADPVEPPGAGDRAATRVQLGVDDDVHLILVFGSLDQRKGIDCLLEGLRRMAPVPKIVALLAGRQTAGLRQELQEPRWQALRASGRVRCMDGPVPQADLGNLFAAADSAWLGYVGHLHASGVFNLAAVSGLPIVATKYGAIGHMAGALSRTYKVDPTDAQQVGHVLTALAREPREPRARAECEQWARQHSIAAFGAEVAAALRSD